LGTVEQLLATAMERGGDFAEVYVERAENTAVVLEERKIRSAQTGLQQGVGIRVISGQKVGYAFSDDLEPEALLLAARTAVLIAHSGGCITTAVWAARHTGPVRAALLVTPPHIDGYEPDDPTDIPWVVPRGKLPFRAVVVASRTDPYTTFAQFERFAEDWGAALVDAGDVGHLDTATGFGPWPDGERLVSDLG